MRSSESHRRKFIAIWCWYQLQKKRVVTLSEIEQNFRCHCEGIMKELVVKGFFLSTSTGDDIGWYFSRYSEGDTLKEFHDKLNSKYKDYE